MPHLLSKISEHAIIVNSHNEVLLLENIHHADAGGPRIHTHKYIFPGGRLEEDSQPGESVLREIREETGLTKIRLLLPFYTSRWGQDNPRYSVIYLARLLDDAEPITLQADEVASYRWESFTNALQLPFITQPLHTALTHAQKLWAIPEVREMDYLKSPIN